MAVSLLTVSALFFFFFPSTFKQREGAPRRSHERELGIREGRSKAKYFG
jgi:hypothetical protein